MLVIQDQTGFVALLPSNSQPCILSSPPASSRDIRAMLDNFRKVFALHPMVPQNPVLQGGQEKRDAGRGQGLQPPAKQSHRTRSLCQERSGSAGVSQARDRTRIPVCRQA